MKLIDPDTSQEINLPDSLLWTDELDWVPLSSKKKYALSGAYIIQQSVRLFGRPISLSPPEDDMSWVPRSTVATLRTWANLPDRRFSLVLEYPTDTRTFVVAFDQESNPLEAVPVRGFDDHNPDADWRVKIKLIEVEA